MPVLSPQRPQYGYQKYRGGRLPSLPTTKSMDINSNNTNLGLTQAVLERQHHTPAAVNDSLAQQILIAAIKPDHIVQHKHTLKQITLTLNPIADDTVPLINLSTKFRKGHVMLLPQHGKNIIHDLVDLFTNQQLIHAKGKHLRPAHIKIILIADTITNSQVNILKHATPQPFIIQQIQITNNLHPNPTNAITLRTLRSKNSLARLHNKAFKLRLLAQGRDFGAIKTFKPNIVANLKLNNLNHHISADKMPKQTQHSLNNQ